MKDLYDPYIKQALLKIDAVHNMNTIPKICLVKKVIHNCMSLHLLSGNQYQEFSKARQIFGPDMGTS